MPGPSPSSRQRARCRSRRTNCGGCSYSVSQFCGVGAASIWHLLLRRTGCGRLDSSWGADRGYLCLGSLPTRGHDRSHRQRHALASAPSLSASRHFCPSRNDRWNAFHARHRVCCERLPHSKLVDIPASPSLEFRIFQLIPGLEENDPSVPAGKSGDGYDDESRAQGDLV